MVSRPTELVEKDMDSMEDEHSSTTDQQNGNAEKIPTPDSSPSTTVTQIDIAAPHSSMSSVSTTTSLPPKPTQTATSTAPQSNLQSLNDDILSRIASHVLSDSRRGTPFYPSKECPDALSFAQASAMFSDAIGRHMTSDHSWLNITDKDTTMNGLTPSFMQKVLAWYTVAAPFLTSLHLHSKLCYFPDLRSRVMNKLLNYRPPLKMVNLSSFDQMAEPSMYSDLVELLKFTRETISGVTLDLTPKMVDVMVQASLMRVTSLEVKLRSYSTAESLMSVLKVVASKEFPLKHLAIRAVRSLPEGLTPEMLTRVAPCIQSLEYHDGGMGTVESFKEGLIGLARCCKQLRKLSLHNCVLDLGCVHSLLDRDKYRSFDNLELVRCNVRDLGAVLAAASDRITHLDLAQDVDAAGLDAIGRCKRVKELSVTMERGVSVGLKGCLAQLRELRGLTLTLQGNGRRVERHVIEGLEHTGSKFEKFVLHGERLQYEAIRHMMRTLGGQLKYWVTGMYTPTKSPSKNILRLLKDSVLYNENMKVLCFGLGLTYDRRGEEMREELNEGIEQVGEKLEGLDTYWLKRNAEAILAIERPEDFEEYESEGSDVEGG